MNEDQMWAQAVALRETAETMIKAGRGSDLVEAIPRTAITALLSAAKRLKGDNEVIAALNVGPDIKWSEALTIANVVYKT